MKENQLLEITYVENIKIDLTAEDKRAENIEFLIDYRRLCLKSLKILIENGLVSDKVHSMLMRCIAELYYMEKKDPNSIEVDPENQEPEYLTSIEKQKEEINNLNAKKEKLKQKIKFTFEKVETLKALRNNFAAVIYVHSNRETTLYNEEEEHLIENPPVVEEVKPENQEPQPGDVSKEGGEGSEDKKEEEVKKDEGKKDGKEVTPRGNEEDFHKKEEKGKTLELQVNLIFILLVS